MEETPRRHYLDEIAESMYRKVQQAVSDWTKENEDKCHPTLACVGPAHVLLLCFHWNQVLPVVEVETCFFANSR